MAATIKEWRRYHLPALFATMVTAVALLAPGDWVLGLVYALGPEGLEQWLESQAMNGSGSGLDKLVHLTLFFVLTGLVYRSLSILSPVFHAWPLLCAAATSLYGFGLELLQALEPARSAEILDGVADMAGAVLSVGSIHLLRTRTSSGRPRLPTGRG